MFDFSQAIASGKTATEAADDAQADLKALQQLAEKQNKERVQALKEQTEFERKEAEEQKKIEDVELKKEQAKQYEQMMIEDERKEGQDGGKSNFEVLADQKAEQDYAMNVFKGSGNMSEVFDKIKLESQTQKAKDVANQQV
mmetsp:Transcript_1030/g.1872  ORF Transcript_1030/g.1872 Transcript_1030/m.1872 type:complete len:141 (+) Transcript_1030:299-721(+)